ncbi:hypothetical protein [Sphingomonas sp. S6]|uniref:hypothetical protein n=1 Tax=Sphingomonas sp. S6 TaxID=3368600 RepID=UPI000FBDDD71|nr:hypothetical protein [uncultured Sphingomonas sp.]RTL16371.1 MAG: hypothetical protein EKK50_11120 [Sphingomonadaceae bacterium]
MDGPCTRATKRRAIEAEAARLFLAAHASGAEADWDAAYRWIAENPAHGCAFARVEAGWDLAAGLRDAAPVRCDEGVLPAMVPNEPARRAAVALGLRRFTMGAIAAGAIGVAVTVWLGHGGDRPPCRQTHVAAPLFAPAKPASRV